MTDKKEKRPLSHPVRVRGLKHPVALSPCGASLVAPRAGAWIETCPLLGFLLFGLVAPRAGAWIETDGTGLLDFIGQMSHPVRVRGLKPY